MIKERADIASVVPQEQTDASRAIHQAAELCRKRGLVAVISDCFDEVPRLMDGLDHLLFLNHEVVLFHVLDPWERDLPLEGNVRFRDLETQQSSRHLLSGFSAPRTPALVEGWIPGMSPGMTRIV